jgi:hypothetical protein
MPYGRSEEITDWRVTGAKSRCDLPVWLERWKNLVTPVTQVASVTPVTLEALVAGGISVTR